MIGYLVLLVGFLVLVKNFFSRPSVRLPPGPSGIPILGYLPWLSSTPHVDISELGKKYGKIWKIQLGSTPVVVINDLDLIKSALKNEAFSGRPNHLPLMSIAQWGTVYSTGAAWKEQRRFTLQSLRDMGFGKSSGEELIQGEVRDLIQYFRKNGKTPSFPREILQVSVINNIWTLLTGEKFSLDDAQVKKFHRLSYDAFIAPPVAGIFMFLPWLCSTFPKLSGFSKMTDACEQLKKMASDMIGKQTSTYRDGELRHFVDAYHKRMLADSENPDSSFSGTEGDLHFIFNILNLFIAGSDTLSSTLSWSIAYLASYPDVLDKLYNEIVQISGKNRLPILEERKRMPYTEAVIAETFRFSSILPGSILHLANETIEFAGYVFPKGTIIMPDLYSVHFSEKIWKNPQKFQPERFLRPDGSFDKSDALMPFSVGKRQCLAENMARDEFFLYLTGLVQNFEFKFHPVTPTLESLKGNAGLVIAPKEYLITFIEREN